MKQILILCTGNSCRSIMAEGLLNQQFNNLLEVKSAGTKPSGKINANAKKILQQNNAWNDNFYSKNINDIFNIDFDLVITVCDGAKETCPIFPKPVKKIHVGFEDPDGKDFAVFEELWLEMNERLIKEVDNFISNS